MCINCRRTSASLSGLLFNYQSTSANVCKESEQEKKKASRKASPTSEVVEDTARAISVREINTCHADLACLELLLDGQLTASTG